MADIRESQFKFISNGVVAENKPLNTDVIEVTPIEHLPFVDGELTQNGTTITAQGTDIHGAAYNTQVASSTTIQAQWLRRNAGNRVTAPDVRRGATVAIYQFADTDKYYWEQLTDDSAIRKLETVRTAYSNTQDESQTELTPDNSYYHEVSTHQGLITLSTSKSNGEPFAYGVQINAKEGYIRIQDDAGMYLIMDSGNGHFEFGNNSKSVLQIFNDKLSMSIPTQIDIQTQTLNINVQQTNHNGLFTENGMLQLNGDMTTAGGTTSGGTGEITVAGNMNLQGNANITGTTTTQQLTSNEAIVAPNVSN